MFHGLDNSFLYSAYRITTEFTSEINEPTAGDGTRFWVMTNQSQLALVTNRHVVDPEYADLKNRGYQLKRLIVSGKCNVPPSKLPDIDVIFEVVDPDVHYSEVYQNDIACIFNPRVKADIGSPTTIDFFVPINLLATAKDYESQFSVESDAGVLPVVPAPTALRTCPGPSLPPPPTTLPTRQDSLIVRFLKQMLKPS